MLQCLFWPAEKTLGMSQQSGGELEALKHWSGQSVWIGGFKSCLVGFCVYETILSGSHMAFLVLVESQER